ncbi:hypothetical protein JTM26_36815, partial [Pseudomonas aeruginosa]|nr:hypothetical protein [Pseudomonas aeruginosa]
PTRLMQRLRRAVSGAGFPMGAGPFFFAAMSTLPTMGLVAVRRKSVPSNGLIQKAVLGFSARPDGLVP